MPGYVLHAAWPVLLVLLYALVTSVLSVLATYRDYGVRVHDIVLESRRRRQQYMDSVASLDGESED